jgi:hypothetical protein
MDVRREIRYRLDAPTQFFFGKARTTRRQGENGFAVVSEDLCSNRFNELMKSRSIKFPAGSTPRLGRAVQRKGRALTRLQI